MLVLAILLMMIQPKVLLVLLILLVWLIVLVLLVMHIVHASFFVYHLQFFVLLLVIPRSLFFRPPLVVSLFLPVNLHVSWFDTPECVVLVDYQSWAFYQWPMRQNCAVNRKSCKCAYKCQIQQIFFHTTLPGASIQHAATNLQAKRIQAEETFEQAL
jgi:hypothetical protein